MIINLISIFNCQLIKNCQKMMQNKPNKKNIKYIDSNHVNNAQKYNNLIMNVNDSHLRSYQTLYINQDCPSNDFSSPVQSNGLNSHKQKMCQAKHCRSLVDLNSSEISFLGVERDLSLNDADNDITKGNINKKKIGNNHSCSSITSNKQAVNSNRKITNRGTVSKILESSNNIQNITRKYFGNGTKNAINAQFKNTSMNSKTNKNIDTNRNEKSHKYIYSINQLEEAKNLNRSNPSSLGRGYNTNYIGGHKIKIKQVDQQASVRKEDEEKQNYQLLMKLKTYIEELKANQQKHIYQIQELRETLEREKQRHEEQLRESNRDYQQAVSQGQIMQDKLKVMSIREHQLISKIKKLKNQKNQQTQHKKNSNCEEHLLIIQSLKNVINEQLSKIIQLEKYKLRYEKTQQCRKQSYQISQNRHENIQEPMKEESNFEGQGFESINMDNEYYPQKNQIEVYSFQKQSNRDFSQEKNREKVRDHHSKEINPYSNRGKDLQKQNISQQQPIKYEHQDQRSSNRSNQYYSGQSSHPDSLEHVPEPYCEILAKMRERKKTTSNKSYQKNQAEEKQKNSSRRDANMTKSKYYISQRQQQPSQISQEQEEDSQESSVNNTSQNINQTTVNSEISSCEDRILSEVGNYLQNLKHHKIQNRNQQKIGTNTNIDHSRAFKKINNPKNNPLPRKQNFWANK